jgi:F0F1-type ATP synthase membrane subunit b/b'
MSKNAMIITAVIAVVIFSYFFWKKRQATIATQQANLAATGNSSVAP